jgi:hypothetical protein
MVPTSWFYRVISAVPPVLACDAEHAAWDGDDEEEVVELLPEDENEGEGDEGDRAEQEESDEVDAPDDGPSNDQEASFVDEDADDDELEGDDGAVDAPASSPDQLEFERAREREDEESDAELAGYLAVPHLDEASADEASFEEGDTDFDKIPDDVPDDSPGAADPGEFDPFDGEPEPLDDEPPPGQPPAPTEGNANARCERDSVSASPRLGRGSNNDTTP